MFVLSFRLLIDYSVVQLCDAKKQMSVSCHISVLYFTASVLEMVCRLFVCLFVCLLPPFIGLPTDFVTNNCLFLR
jgi:hypothetical protein